MIARIFLLFLILRQKEQEVWSYISKWPNCIILLILIFPFFSTFCAYCYSGWLYLRQTAKFGWLIFSFQLKFSHSTSSSIRKNFHNPSTFMKRTLKHFLHFNGLFSDSIVYRTCWSHRDLSLRWPLQRTHFLKFF